MNPLDIAIIVVCCFTCFRGLFRGLAKELASIVGVLGGFYAAYTYYPNMAALLSRWITDTGYLYLISYLIVFSGVFLAVSIAGVIIKYLLNIVFLGGVDRVFGAGFGLLKGVLIVFVLLIALTAFLPKGAAMLRGSLLAPHVAALTEQMAKVVSKDMKHQFIAKMNELKKTWQMPR